MGFIARIGRLFRADAYSTTSSVGRNANWRPPVLGPNRALDYSADVLRNQSRELVRKNALAASAIERIVSNTVGTGIKPKLADDAVAALWLRWTDESAADGQLDFYGQQQQVMSAVATSGECFVRLRNRLPIDGLSVPLQLEILESEFVPMSLNRSAEGDFGDIRQGIEFDRNLKSKRVAYWICPRHPGESNPMVSSIEPVRLPASEILHVYLPTRPGQIRGEPWMARVLDRLQDLDAYDKAELIRKKTAALLVGFIKRLLPEGLSLADLSEIYGDDADIQSDGVGAVSMEPGTMQVLQPGEDVSFNAPSDVGGQYEVFKRSHQRDIAAALGLLYEQLTGDYSQVNDRTWRAAVTEFRRRCEGWQHHLLVFQFCRPVGRRWAEMALFSRALPAGSIDPMAPIEWTPEAWAYINPVQDVQARREEVLAGFTTRAAIVSERGGDVSAIDAENAADQERADELGLVYATDGRVAANANPTVLDAMPEPVAPMDPNAQSDKAIAAVASISQDTIARMGDALQRMVEVSAKVEPPAPPPIVNLSITPQIEVDVHTKANGKTQTTILAHDERGRILKTETVPVAEEEHA